MVKMLIHSVPTSSSLQQHIVLLQDEEGHRILSIWIGEAEAFVLNALLTKTAMPRPMTAQLMANLLKATGTRVEEIRIESLKDEIFYAIVKVHNGDTVQEVDARPSDALTLGLLIDSPIYVAEEVMERAAITLPEGETLHVEGGIDEETSLKILGKVCRSSTAMQNLTPVQREAATKAFVEFLTTNRIPHP